MSSIYAIPFGQADCFVVALDTGNGRRYVLIDGGTRKHGRNELRLFLEDNNISSISLLAVTHMHQDHIGYIPEMTGRLHTETALLPFRAKLMRGMMIDNSEMREDYFDLLRIAMNLENQHTKIYYNNSIQKYQSFVMGDYMLTVIYPNRDSTLTLTKESSLINGDSSVMLLTKGKRQLALFCGDCFEENFSGLYFQYVEDNCLEKGVEVLKLSHHGRNDKGHIYYTEDFLKKISPRKAVITSDTGNIKKYSAEWKRILTGTDTYVIEDKIMEIGIEE